MTFRMFILNFNPKKGYYLYPQFSPQKNAKQENTPFLWGHNFLKLSIFCFKFFLVTLQVLPFEKIIVGKISHGVGGGGPSIMFNLRKIYLKFVFCYIMQCNFFRKLPITHLLSIKTKQKKYACLYDHRTYFKVKNKYLDFMGMWGPQGALTQFFSNLSFTLQSSLHGYK